MVILDNKKNFKEALLTILTIIPQFQLCSGWMLPSDNNLKLGIVILGQKENNENWLQNRHKMFQKSASARHMIQLKYLEEIPVPL